MTEADPRRLPHLLLRGTATSEPFTSPRSGRDRFVPPVRDRLEHGANLLSQLRAAEAGEPARKETARATGLPDPTGILLTFRSDPEGELALKSLEAERSGIRLHSVCAEGPVMVATVFVPDGKLKHFTDRISAYLAEDRNGKPKNEKLVASIAEITRTVARHLWTDDAKLYPSSSDPIWWEVWVRTATSGAETSRFREAARTLGLTVRDRSIAFLERQVFLAYGSLAQIERSVELLDMIAELRRAKDSPSDFTEMSAKDQRAWAASLLARLTSPGLDAPAVCLLDTGVNHRHPLLAPAIANEDVQACIPGWTPADQSGHGTGMAGLALYGDLLPLLASSEPIVLRHRLESVRIVPATGQNDPELYGKLTMEAIARAEVAAPHRRRACCLAVSSKDNLDRGAPSSWSAEVDALSSGSDDGERRLIIVAAGNVDRRNWTGYPDVNLSDSIHDPGQAWNALTIGAFTDRSQLDPERYPDWSLVAHPGGLSPSSTTSQVWAGHWPLKPDLVLEGGNAAVDPGHTMVDTPDDLSLLTTHQHHLTKLFVTTGDTSGAAALAARLAATLMAEYPDLWPETVRALLVHSAEWTGQMLREYPLSNGTNRRIGLLRTYGYGVPDLERARRSARNDVCLVAQDQLQVFRLEGSELETADMNLHRLPWPIDILRDLGGQEVRLRVTLSYFIEPNPAKRGWTVRHAYRSHGLRFGVKHPTENEAAFRARINREARAESDAEPRRGPEDRGWLLGPRVWERGSLHSDTWIGTAADLADRGVIAVYPVGGWWRERPKLDRWQRPSRYALVVSIATPDTEVDIYTPITTLITTPIEISR